jgi:hypothetical protein
MDNGTTWHRFREWYWDRNHAPLLFVGAVIAVLIVVNWHPWTGSAVEQAATTAQTVLQAADTRYTACLGPFNPNALPPSNATYSMCTVSYATAVHGIAWPNPTTATDGNNVINDADALAGIYNSGAEPTEAEAQQFGADRGALSTAISDTISAAGG